MDIQLILPFMYSTYNEYKDMDGVVSFVTVGWLKKRRSHPTVLKCESSVQCKHIESAGCLDEGQHRQSPLKKRRICLLIYIARGGKRPVRWENPHRKMSRRNNSPGSRRKHPRTDLTLFTKSFVEERCIRWLFFLFTGMPRHDSATTLRRKRNILDWQWA